MPFQKGHPGFKKPGTKHAITLDKEARRAIFDEEVSKVWIETVKKLPPTYVADQFLGKATETIDLNAQIDFIFKESEVTTKE